MNETRKLRNAVTCYALAAAGVAELVSLIFTKGFHIGFFYGLALGTTIGIVNFSILAFTLSKALTQKKAGAGFFFIGGYVVRMFIYGGAFLIAYQTDVLSGLACIIGFLTAKVSIYYVNFVKKSIFTEKKDRGV